MVAIAEDDRPDPQKGIRILVRVSWFAIAALLAGFAAAPNNPLLTLVFIGLVVYVMVRGRRYLSFRGLEEEAVTSKRSMTFTHGLPIPMMNGKPCLDPKRPYWEPEDVCFEKVKSIEKIRTGETVSDAPWYLNRVLPEYLAQYQAQEKWLKEICPEQYRVVRTWWLRGFVVPALVRRFKDFEFKLTEHWDPIEETKKTATRKAGLDGLLPDRWVPFARDKTKPDAQWIPANTEWCQEVAKDYQYHLFAGIRIAVQPQNWTRRIDRRPSQKPFGILQNALLDLYQGNRPKTQVLPDSLRIKKPVYSQFYFGHGFAWDKRHTQALHETLGEDISKTTGGKPTDGDPRIYACGQDEIRPIFLDENLLNAHAGILGAPGSGKTRFLENILVQAIESGRPILLIDPKLDRGIFNRIWEIARRCGRANKLHLFHLNAPRCQEVSDWNPLFAYDDPAELAARCAAVIPSTRDPFWKTVGVSTCKAVTMMSHYVMLYLRIVGAEKIDGKWTLAPRYGHTPPKYLLALQWQKDNPTCTPKEARKAVEEFLLQRCDINWEPQNVAQAHLLEMARLPFFSPKGWNPSLKPVNVFGVGKPETMIAWALRVVFFHLWMKPDGKKSSGVNLPDLLDLEAVISSDPSSWWQIYLRHKDHPIKTYLDPDFRAAKDLHSTLEFLHEFLPPEAIDDLGRTDCVAWDRYIHDSLRMMYSKASEDRKEYQKHMSTLAASLANFEGERERLVCSEDPNIIIRDIVKQGGIACFAMNFMKDPVTSESCAKTIVVDSLSFLGDVYGASSRGRYEFYFCADEIGTFLTADMVPLMSQGRAAGVRAALLGQNGVDIEVAMGDRAKADQTLGNLVTKIVLCTENPRDAKSISEELGKCTIRVKRSYSLNTTRAYGPTGVQTIGDYSQSQNDQWEDRDVDRMPFSSLYNLPTGHAFINSKFGQHMVIQGQLPEPQNSILEEFGILKYSDDEPEPEIAINLRAEYDETNKILLTDGIFPNRPAIAATDIPASVKSRFAQDRAADIKSPSEDTGSQEDKKTLVASEVQSPTNLLSKLNPDSAIVLAEEGPSDPPDTPPANESFDYKVE